MCSKGQFVYSKSGRDKHRPFIVFDYDENYVYIVDGDLRKLDKPKKKNKKHIQIVKEIDYNIKTKLDENIYLNDADIRKALKAYIN